MATSTCSTIFYTICLCAYNIVALPTPSPTNKDPMDQNFTQNSKTEYLLGIQGSSNKDFFANVRKNPTDNLMFKIAIFIDFKMYEYWNHRYSKDTEVHIRNFVDATMENVNILYNQPSLGHRIHFKVVRVEMHKEQSIDLKPQEDANNYQSDFCKWQKSLNITKGQTWDHALLLTGTDIRENKDFHVMGLSSELGMCSQDYSCTIVEALNFQSTYIIAHELGHSFGMKHDQINNNCEDNYIMSKSTGEAKTTWSSCNKEDIDRFIRFNIKFCSPNVAEPFNLEHASQFPGQRYNAEDQCKIFGGYDLSNKMKLNDICRMLYCTDETQSYTAHPALDGTYCGPGKWCRHGDCIEWGDSGPHLVDGGWSSWSDYSENQASCLEGSVGIKVASRICNNPKPQNGGKMCEGLAKKYKSYSLNYTKPISSIQDFANNECHQKIPLNPLLTGLGLQLFSDSDKSGGCKVWCYYGIAEYSSLGNLFPDGTDCSNRGKNNPAYCVSGKCKRFHKNGFIFHQAELTAEEDFESEWRTVGSCESSCLNESLGIQLYARSCETMNLDASTCKGEKIHYKICDPKQTCGTKPKQTKEAFAENICLASQKYDAALTGKTFLHPYDQSKPQRSCKVFCWTKKGTIRNFGHSYPNGTMCSTTPKGVCQNGVCKIIGCDKLMDQNNQISC